MAGAESAAGARADGLLSSLKRLVTTLVAIGQTRLELLSVELQAERRRLTAMLVFGAAAIFFLACGILLLTLLVIVAFWDSNRLLAIGLCALFYFGVGTVLAVLAKQRAAEGSHIFESSLAELSKDRERLSA